MSNDEKRVVATSGRSISAWAASGLASSERGAVRQIYALALEDLARHPTWAYLSEDNADAADECTVRATPLGEIESSEQDYVARTEFELAGGTRLPGFVAPHPDLGISQPVVFVRGGRFGFWSGIEVPERALMDAFYEALGLSPAEIFPMAWTCEFAMDGSPSTGVVPGFGYIDVFGRTAYRF